MAKCQDCDRDMLDKVGCTLEYLVDVNGIQRRRLKETLCNEFEEGRCCHDCCAPPMSFHHLGCDNEPCPICDHQLISCSCWEHL